MFAAPPEAKTRVFARIPDRYRQREGTTRWIDVMQKKPTDCFIEGPSFDRDGNLYIVDVAWGRIFRISPDAQVELIAEYDGEPNGLKIHSDGRIFIADYRHGIMLLDPVTGRVTPHLDRATIEPFKGVNDLVFASNGDLYFTDQGLTGLHDPTGRLYRLRRDGQLDLLLNNIPSPNGLVLSLDESSVFVNVTRANAVWRVPLLPGGVPYKVGEFIRMSGGGGPDGLAMDVRGNLAVAHLGLGTVWLFSALGEPLLRIRSCAGLATTNVAYGGPGGHELYITESETGSVLVAQMDVPGQPMYSHAGPRPA
ncbi:MAG: SMP-30/gluconolactonase/LRE family protein [Pseudomonadota bacterium]